ncbi:MAG: VIT domain-containing protein [Planctomycetota bacterium]
MTIHPRAFRMMILAGLLLMSTAGTALACRIEPWPIIRPPHPHPNPPPLAADLTTKSHRAEISITGAIAATKLEATFYNPNPSEIEGTYWLPIRGEAAVTNFAMTANGKKLSAELLSADKAREIYENIVRQRKDPALLEYLGNGVLQARVYPIPARGDVAIGVDYSQTMKGESGAYTFRYPLGSAKPVSGAVGQIIIKVHLAPGTPLKAIYSPSHPIAVNRKGDREAEISYEANNVTPTNDFILYYTTAAEDMGASLVAYTPAGEDPYFLLMVAPKFDTRSNDVFPKDVVLVLDTSGSMAGDKIRQAKEALRFCVNTLNAKDRFNIIAFSSETRPFREGNTLLDATDDNRKAALAFIDGISAAGGTAIQEALEKALAPLGTAPTAGRLSTVIFLTDGLPTVGETDINKILAVTKDKNTARARLFVFGVGTDVNTDLLDKLAVDSRGDRNYVTGGENLEEEVSRFSAKIANPVFTDVAMAFQGIETYDIYPRTVPDFFKGTQILISGRMKIGATSGTVRLAGNWQGEKREFTFPVSAGAGADAAFLPRLWATRKVAFLLEEIRLRGKNQELVDEVVALGKKFGIVTPYTSYLIVEEGELQRNASLRDRLDSVKGEFESGGRTGGRAVAESKSLRKMSDAPAAAAGPRGYGGGLGSDFDGAEKAVMATTGGQGRVSIHAIADRIFYKKSDGFLHDAAFDLKAGGTPVAVKAFSDEYFTLLREKPALAKYLAGGEKMILVFAGTTYRIE